jgi:hypothetical protein
MTQESDVVNRATNSYAVQEVEHTESFEIRTKI